jgi:hypothetical protein
MFLSYVFFVPFLYFSLIPGLNPLTYPVDFFVSGIGFVVSFLYFFLFRRQKLEPILLSLFFALCFSFFLSLIVSLCLFSFSQSFFGTSPFLVGLKNSLFIFHSFLLLCYCYINIRECNKEAFFLSFFLSLLCILISGLLQCGILLGSRVCAVLNDWFAYTGLVRPSSYFVTVHRIALLTPEPAWTSGVLFCYIFPCSFWFLTEKKDGKFFVFFLIVSPLFVLFEFLTKSTEVYFTTLFYMVFWYLVLAKRLIKGRRFLYLFLISYFLILGFGYGLLNQSIRSVVVEKISTSNYSTATRLSYVYNALLTFLAHPIFGVGNGLQAYFYANNVGDTWMAAADEVKAAMNFENGAPTFAPFIFYFLAGYGIVGCVPPLSVFYLFLKSLFPKELVGKRIYLVGLLTYFFLGCFTENIISNYYLPLFLCLPFLFQSGPLLDQTQKYEKLNYHSFANGRY